LPVDRLVAVTAIRFDAFAPPGARSAPAIEDDLSVPPPLQPATTPPAGEKPETGPQPPPPRLPTALAALAPGELSLLERGLQQFLEQLEDVGQALTGQAERAGLRLWVVAAATAAAACEIARRQMKQPPDRPL